MAHLKGTLLACLGAALIALAAVSLKAGEPGPGAAKDKDAAVSGHMVIFQRSREFDPGAGDKMAAPGYSVAMISIVIPTLNADARLGDCLNALVSPALDGIVKEVIVVDGGSRDATLAMADSFGTRILTAPPGRGGQLKAGAEAAKAEWLLFLHADTVLEEGWADEAVEFMTKRRYEAGVFTLQFDAKGLAPKLVAAGAMARTCWFKSPYGDQGLFISKKTYEEIGGFADIPLFEDVDIIKRLLRIKGPHALHIFSSKAVTSAERYEREGYARRVWRNCVLHTRYQLGAAPEKLAKAYR